ncbi:hypothetical protein FJ420_17100 [Mesorhizobium sp. B3-1-3]|uniref:hypothetical protein n=1 Tax=unclassified Mesorhizobium TaxID=325217 RepID=UPI0011276511|nr:MULTISPECIES: hypothetical protein [unclassified Mesorhizobium]TPI64271.1 hypothetical protein FJ424_18060 [Mesorhizobium sp. B3-1-8]TPI70249.1 hypothetical protein FJ420_17100 [Mesorhizobium sp. B3-1-3]
MIAAGIVFVGARPVRFVLGDTSTFSRHVQPGESLLITSDDIYTDGLPDPEKAQRVLDAALSTRLRVILW